MKRCALLLFFLVLVGLSSLPSSARAEGEGNFEIMKATADKIWRLNKTTGEISICTLAGERLQCTSSSEAIRPPKMTYEEHEANNERLAKENRAKDLEFLDRAFKAIRSLFEASMERESN